MEYKNIILSKENHIATITLNRPDKMNALNEKMTEELANALVEQDRQAELYPLIPHFWKIAADTRNSHFQNNLTQLYKENLWLVDQSAPVQLLQEMNREANTMGSKASDVEVGHRVVDIKEEIERIREQVQNVE